MLLVNVWATQFLIQILGGQNQTDFHFRMLILRGKVDVFSCRGGAGAPDRRDAWRVGCWLSGIWQIGVLSEGPGNLSVLTLTAAEHKNPSKRNNSDRFLEPSGRSSAEMQKKC